LVETTQKTTYGYYLTAFTFPTQNGKYSSYLTNGIQSELLIKNIWRSPLGIFNSYKNYSVSQMTLLNVVLLFGTNQNGSLFLALNTGTPISSITNYGLTTLNNFINIVRAFIIEFDNNSQLADYFMDESTINGLKKKGYNVELVPLQALIDTNTISNPKSVLENPNMYYFLLHSPNNINLIMDISEQNIINADVKPLDNENKTYNVTIILPESSFKITNDETNSLINIYKDLSSCYYINSMPYSVRFDKLLTIDNGIVQKSMGIDKITLIASNNSIF
jgi:hypothetical protein